MIERATKVYLSKWLHAGLGYVRTLMKQSVLLITAVLFGLLITYVDSRPHWDDAGIIALGLLLGSGVIELLAEKRPWLFALAVGVWLPLWYLVTTHNLSMIFVLIFPFVGAYVGWVLNLGLRKSRPLGS